MATVSVDSKTQHQTLIGFGASVAYDENVIVNHPNKESLYDLMFLESGFDVVRIGNWFDAEDTTSLDAPAEIVAAAGERLGQDPILFMTSGSPPPSLKANGNRFCANADPNCTLSRDLDGGFDYARFAEHWRASLQAFANAGIEPDYVSIQNNAAWIPSGDGIAEACRFLPQEGTSSITTPQGEEIQAEFPGYVEALNAVQAAIADLEGDYSFAAPETGSAIMAEDFAESLSATNYHALALHLYGTDPVADAPERLEEVGILSRESDRPVLQSEMSADGISTAILTHYTLALANGSAYIHQPFVGTNLEPSSVDLIGLDGDDLVTLPAYHALAHFARDTDPGWIRVDASSDATSILSTAWMAPDESALTIVLVNPTEGDVDVELDLEATPLATLANARITRTVFEGIERSVDLGALPENGVVRVPGKSILTVSNR